MNDRKERRRGPWPFEVTDGGGGASSSSSSSSSSKVTALIEIRGAQPVVLQQAAQLLRLVVEELDGARLRSLGLDYDPGPRPAHVLDAGAADPLEVAGRGASSIQEAELWRLALDASTADDSGLRAELSERDAS